MLFKRLFVWEDGSGEAWADDPDGEPWEGWVEIPRFSLDWWGHWMRKARFSFSDILLVLLATSTIVWIAGSLR
jgi:hypothetical protein